MGGFLHPILGVGNFLNTLSLFPFLRIVHTHEENDGWVWGGPLIGLFALLFLILILGFFMFRKKRANIAHDGVSSSCVERQNELNELRERNIV